MTNAFSWKRQPLRFSKMITGPAAWHAQMLHDGHGDFLAKHPSLLVCDETVSSDELGALGKFLHQHPREHFPIMLRLNEPEFSRRLPEMIRSRLNLLTIPRIELFVLNVIDATELKSGGVMQNLLDLRSAGLIRHIGLSHSEVNSCEWLALNMSARALVLPYELHNLTARYRAIKSAEESEMDCISRQITPISDHAALAFALGDHASVLPVLDAPLPEKFAAMSVDEVNAAWAEYQRTHHAPPPLPRSNPPAD